MILKLHLVKKFVLMNHVNYLMCIDYIFYNICAFYKALIKQVYLTLLLLPHDK